MSPCLCRGHFAPAVQNFLLFRQRIMGARKNFDIFGKNSGQFSGGCFAFCAVMTRQEIKRALNIFFYTLNHKTEAGDCFIKKLFPRIPNCAKIMNKFLQFITKLVWFHCAHPLKNPPVAPKFSVLRQKSFDMVILKPVQFEREKNQRCREIGDLFLTVRKKLGTLPVGRHLIIPKTCIGHYPPRDRRYLFVAGHAKEHVFCVECSKFSLIICGESRTFFFQPA